MSSSLSPASAEFQRNTEDFPASVDKLQLIEEDVLQSPVSENHLGSVCEENTGSEELRTLVVWSEELTFDLLQLQRQTEQELGNIHTQLFQIEGRRQLLTSELFHLHKRKKQIEQELRRSSGRQTSFHLCACRELQASITERLVQSEELVFQEEALISLRHLLSRDLHRYQEETERLRLFTQKILKPSHRSDGEEAFANRRSDDRSIQGKTEENMLFQQKSESSSSSSAIIPQQTTNEEEKERVWNTHSKKPPTGLSRSSNLHRGGSVKNLIGRFSGSDPVSPTGSFGVVQSLKSEETFRSTMSTTAPSLPSSVAAQESPVPSITVSPPLGETRQNEAQSAPGGTTTNEITARTDCPVGGGAEKTDAQATTKTQSVESGRDSVADSGMGSEPELDSNKQLDSPLEDEPTTPRAVTTSQNPKYQLFLNNDLRTNGLSSREADAPGGGGAAVENGPRMSRWETSRLGPNHYRGSLESLASRDWDTLSDRFLDDTIEWKNLKVKLGAVDSPPRVFNSPYTTAASMDYNPMYRMSEFKVPSVMSPATSEMNLYSFNGRSTSPVGIPSSTMPSTRIRYSAYDSLLKRRAEANNNTVLPNTHYIHRSNTMGGPGKKDYIEELTKQLDVCHKRNQFLEADRVEMEKEREQIRFEMRGLLVNNEDVIRANAQLTNEMKRMREQMIEMERESQSMGEKYREMEIEVREARDMMVEANTQEYAFNFLQQSLKNRIQDAEENLEKQTQHAKTLAEKLWSAERQLEELEVDKDSKDKRTSELNSNLLRLETELSEALLVSSQASAEVNLHQKLRDDAHMRVEELEETLLEKDQELQRLENLVSRLQGEVSGKLIDKERTLEEEIQLRERIQLQCKQAERTVEDLHMELQGTNQTRDDLAKQLKQAQEKMIDMESDLEELHDSEQRWAAKHKRAIEQMEQLQLKVIQEKDLNDQLETDKVVMERQLRELRLEVDELQSSRVPDDVVSRAESRAKELENLLRTEERNKAVLTNTIGKLERRINELSDQMEEEHRIANEQKDLMNQRIRSLKRQLNEAEEDASRKEAHHRMTQRELSEEMETNASLRKQLQGHHQKKQIETLTIRQTLDNLRLDLSVDEEDEQPLPPPPPPPPQQTENVTKV